MSTPTSPDCLYPLWCDCCNQTMPHELQISLGGKEQPTRRYRHNESEYVTIPVVASLVCVECQTTYDGGTR